ncbi:hypothetical protein EMPS_03256 [Entomortierella parvispora]|uniref:Uncharacterized protein n=1 Tax=Entomortierella parvispora TaxID=205924 RepID=A0A9P3H6F4_9FUNG|nr:hypothetical protein EMPS_03256 [Entomortierella parvispora]
MDRPSIRPIATTSGTTSRDLHSCPEIATHIDKASMAPGLPSPPLSPQQDLGVSKYGKRHFRSSLQFSSVAHDHEPSVDEQESLTFGQGISDLEEVDPSIPMLPSQLRKRHESIKLASKAQQLQQQQQDQLREQQEREHQEQQMDREQGLDDPNYIESQVPSETDLDPSIAGEDDDDDIELIHGSYHSGGALVRAKSFSMFESRGHDGHHGSTALLSPSQRLLATQGLLSPSAQSLPSTRSTEMPTRDWVKMQSKIQALEMEVSHVSRTNLLLNQELDKVNAHLARVTAGDEDGPGQGGESWRREYEFLVQQIDVMHRQLQIAHSEQHARASRAMTTDLDMNAAPGQQAEMTRQLYAEVKDLTASLRLWQSAFQQAEQKYRQKCDGERALKQTLRERETQLSSLVDKLSGYESEFRKSISNYEEWMRLSTELQGLEGASGQAFPRRRLSIEGGSTSDSHDTSKNELDLVGMPGTFPGGSREKEPIGENASIDQLSVSILSWAALLATYMLS